MSALIARLRGRASLSPAAGATARGARGGTPGRAGQRGATVLLALVTVALVSALAVRLLVGQEHWLRQVSLQGDRMQSLVLGDVGLNYARAVLADDERRGGVDHAQEAWARPLPPMSVEGGLLAGRVFDLQGRLNLNDAAALPPDGRQAATPPGTAALVRLFAALELPPTLLATLADWIDADNEPRAGGAEDAYYLSLPTPYRGANQPLESLDELALVRGFNADTIARLRPHVVALPPGTLVNVSAAAAPVLQPMLPTLSAEEAAALRRSGDRKPFASLEDFRTRAEELGAELPGVPGLAVSSGWFEIVGDVQWGEAYTRMQMIVERQGGGRMPRIARKNVL